MTSQHNNFCDISMEKINKEAAIQINIKFQDIHIT